VYDRQKGRVRKKRQVAADHQGGHCFWCDSEMLTYEEAGKDQNHSWLATAEHLVPKSQGGVNSRQNIVAACWKCNTARKNNPLEIWLSRLKFRLTQAGNPSFFETILSRLKARGISLPVGQPGNGPDAATAESPPPQDKEPAPQG
jgi:hypothetical protein